jgi:hypothetical protein
MRERGGGLSVGREKLKEVELPNAIENQLAK